MNHTINPEVIEIIDASHYRPALSILLPLHIRINLKAEAAYALKVASDKAEIELHKYYPDDVCELIMGRLRKLISIQIVPEQAKSIALYISPVFEKVLYLDSEVEEKIIVDESFEIRDLIYAGKQHNKFLLLLLSGMEFRVFLGDGSVLRTLQVSIPDFISAYKNDVAERVENFSDISERKQVTIEKFLRHIDSELGQLIHRYNIPVIALGAEKILGHFRKLTVHAKMIIDYIKGNYFESTEAQLKELVQPHLNLWKASAEKELLQRLEVAAGQKLLASGIQEVWQTAFSQKGRLLVVEKNYRYSAQRGSEEGIIDPVREPYNPFSYIRDAVDDVIEKVLKSGGDVEFVEDKVLAEFNHIALIRYY